MTMYAVHAMPSSNLAARDTVNDQDRDSIQGSGVHFVKRAQEGGGQEVKDWKAATEGKAMSKRFVRNPDYSQGGTEGGSNSVSPATKSEPTQEAPAPDAPVATAKVDPGARPAARV
ncbi:hypothetical protein PAXRUDRAFT_834249 [Paxillus rubicundulus Ve08.2h10]|uniref:Uncharacterized protein n=1 Tax=Paxillus rubicundulus Ve08.2h10 TaxID=930991 RepID=A0A0D0DLC9_9AGAM|nr:hypothetical protein PAXRUDRAFT_834249 [Paxillus rubicundulus Ve08.2h10]